MSDAATFLTVMAALSAAVQTFVDHVIKRRVSWLDAENKNAEREKWRHTSIHAISFVVGFALAWSLGVNPLTYLGVSRNPMFGFLLAGLLVSFGGGFFNDVLGAVREFKKAQEQVREARAQKVAPQ